MVETQVRQGLLAREERGEQDVGQMAAQGVRLVFPALEGVTRGLRQMSYLALAVAVAAIRQARLGLAVGIPLLEEAQSSNQRLMRELETVRVPVAAQHILAMEERGDLQEILELSPQVVLAVVVEVVAPMRRAQRVLPALFISLGCGDVSYTPETPDKICRPLAKGVTGLRA